MSQFKIVRFIIFLFLFSGSMMQLAKHKKYKLVSDLCQDSLDQRDAHRLQSYSVVANKLACLSNNQLSELLSTAQWTSGWGQTGTINVDGVLVFIKKIPLTDFEQKLENMYSTANIFNLPLFYQYGVGSAGFGAYRELAAQIMASNWVLSGASKNFPIVYHWRLLSHSFAHEPIIQEKMDKKVAYWNGSSSVRHRLESMNTATSSIVIFMESMSQTLHSFLMQKVEEGKHQFDHAVKMIDQDLKTTVSFMADHGMIHFDAHGDNLLTDGNHVYFADFGLALSSNFDLSEEEKAFFIAHKNYDKIYVQADLVWNICEALKFDEQDALAQLQKYVDGDQTMIHSPYITSILQKYARSALLFDQFMTKLRKESKLTPYPADEITAVLAATDYK